VDRDRVLDAARVAAGQRNHERDAGLRAPRR
jgi:hypothetical protein